MRSGVLIVGAGQAGSQVAISLREAGYRGRVTVVGDEPYLPYHRPPLSKAFLKGDASPDSLALRGDAAYRRHDVDVLLGARVVDVDAMTQTAHLDGGQQIGYEWLVLAQGGVPRGLSVPFLDADTGAEVNGAETAGVHYLRQAEDAIRLREKLAQANSVVVVGGGFIGLEVAAAATELGAGVTVLEMADRLMARVVHPAVAEFYRGAHSLRKVDILTDTRLDVVLVSDGHVCGVRVGSGRAIFTDLVVVGVGLIADTDLAARIGLEVDRGVVIDENGRTSDPRVFAAGDCATRRLPSGATERIESIHNAIEQAKVVAAAIANAPAPRPRAPWFWSDQFDLKLQIAGWTGDDTDIEIDGSLDEEKFVITHRRHGRLVGITAVSSPREFLRGRTELDRLAHSAAEPVVEDGGESASGVAVSVV
ncbi:NAD(P)/FAD-dependent oxidoreductase [Agromyces sp. NPDC058484]|uniref:NAD(P)/FAD-dependent oxidoreductase n=1 Tax=Agromyces sp. NPDC058484 TaxID=3346524 RepID=UPI003658DFAA